MAGLIRSLWESTSDVLVKLIREEANAPPRTADRRKAAEDSMSVYRDDFGALLDVNLRSIFHPENYNSLRLLPHTSTNILRRVVDETCLVYQEPATRFLSGDAPEEKGGRLTATGTLGVVLELDDLTLAQGGAEAVVEGALETTGAETPLSPAPPAPPQEGVPAEVPKEEEGETPFERFLAACDLDSLMEECHRLARIHPCVWIRPVVRKGDDGKMHLDFDLYTPNVADVEVEPTDKTRASAWYTWTDEKRGVGIERVYYWWSESLFLKFDARWNEIPNDLAGGGMQSPNPLGRLPIVPVRLARPLDRYYLDGQGNDLYEATLEVALLRTLENARFRDSSFKQLVIEGNPKDVPPAQVMGNPSIPIYVEGGARVVPLDLAPAMMQTLRESVRERMEDIAVRYGISPASWSMTERAASGFSKKLDQAKVQRLNRKERKWLAKAERDLYRLVAQVLATYDSGNAIFGGALDPEAEMVVDFAEPRFEEEPLTQAKADAANLKLGLASIVDLVMRDNPDLTEEQAVAFIARNRALNDRFLWSDEQAGPAISAILGIGAQGGGEGAGPGAPGETAPPMGSLVPMEGLPAEEPGGEEE